MKKTRIYNTKDLKPGDVILIIEVGQRKKHPTWPLCNFRRLCMVTEVEQLKEGEYVFHQKAVDRLTSTDGTHEVIRDAMSGPKPCILDNGAFGCNDRIEGRHKNLFEVVYRLDNITNKEFVAPTMPNLVGNPGYDLMHDPKKGWNN